jgi:transposase-like protein DUF772
MLWLEGLMGVQPGFFDLDERHGKLSAAGDPLERLADFELFRDDLEAALERSDRSKGGRPPYDAILMFKVLVLQTLYTLSDDQTGTGSRSCAFWVWRRRTRPRCQDDLAVPRAADPRGRHRAAVRVLRCGAA